VNAERLHLVAQAIRTELQEMRTLPSIEQLLTGLQGLANQPSDAASQQQISEARTALRLLVNAPSNSWPVSDRQVAEDLGVADLMGEPLMERVEAVLSVNEMTPAVAAAEIEPIAEDLRQATMQLDALVGALDYFDISRDESAPEAEIIFTIPRSAVHQDLRELGDEFAELSRILAPFQEIVTGTRSGIPVESISSSAFGLELLAIPAFAYGVARAVNEILTVYKNILEIREARNRLKESGVPDDALAQVDDHANQAMQTRNDALASELLAELPVAESLDEGRRNELVIELRLSLNAIANRIDKGYEIDVRAPEPEDAPEGEEEADPVLDPELTPADFQRQIRVISPQLRAERVGGAAILELPEGPRSEPGGADEQ